MIDNNIEDQGRKLLNGERFQSFFSSIRRLVKKHEFRKVIRKAKNQVV